MTRSKRTSAESKSGFAPAGGETIDEAVAGLQAVPGVLAIHDARYPAQAIARTLRHAREAAGLTQEQVAARMGTQRNAVTRLESPRSQPPSMRQVIKYADACGVTLHIEARPKASPDAPALQAITGAEFVKPSVRRNQSRSR